MLPGMSRSSVDLPHGTIHYLDTGGNGPPIVFVHGLLVDGRLWRKVVAELEGEFRCIVPDLPLGSHTTPMKPGADMTPRGVATLIADFIRALGLERPAVVANDTGGALTQIMITDHPGVAGPVVLTPCDTFDNFLPKAFRPLQYAAKVPGVFTALAQGTRVAVLRRPVFALLTKRPIPDAITEAWARPYLQDAGVRRDTLRFVRAIHTRYTLDAAARLGSFDQPVLLAWAPEDPFFKFDHAQRLAQIIPDARIETVEDSLAFVPEDQPERLAELIRGFVPRPAATPPGTHPPAPSPEGAPAT
jgi:pimeloyl-ACP methyl ester carboxylesterase